MYYYIVCFLLSTVFMWMAERRFRKNSKNSNRLGWLLGGMAVLLLCCLAGFRDTSVGIDVNVYVTPYFNIAKSTDSFATFMTRVAVEPGYALLVYISAHLFETPVFILFICQLLVIGPLFFLFYKFRKDISITFAYLIYELLFFNMTLCIMRQCMAAVILMLGFYFLDRKKRTAVLLCVIACTIHNSAILCIPIFFVLRLSQRKKLSNIYTFAVIAALCIGLMFINNILSLAVSTGLLPPSYYAVFLAQSNLSDFSILEKAIMGGAVLIPFSTSLLSKNEDFKKFAYYALFGYILSFATVKSQYLVRLSYMFQFYVALALPYGYCNLKILSSKKSNRMIYQWLFVLVMMVYWYIIYMNWNYFGTAKYIFL